MLEKYAAHLVVDAGGWAEPRRGNRELATRFFLEGMHDLDLLVANVAGRDLTLGPAALEHLEDSTGVQFVSANVLVRGRPRFRPWIVMDKHVGGRTLRIGITGVTLRSRAALEAWPDSLQLEFADPLQAARDVLEALRPQTDVRVLLAFVPRAQLEDLVGELPVTYDVVVSSVGQARDATPLGATPVVLAPGPQCKRLGWVNVVFERPGHLEIVGGNQVTLDAKVEDDPVMAARVQRFKERLKAAASASQPAVSASAARPRPAPAAPPSETSEP